MLTKPDEMCSSLPLLYHISSLPLFQCIRKATTPYDTGRKKKKDHTVTEKTVKVTKEKGKEILCLQTDAETFTLHT